jgi:ABC-type molybdate transport system permease subunit
MDEMWLLIAPLVILQLGLMIFALLDWARRPQTRYLNRWVWLPIILFLSLLGPLAYFLLGREEA